MKELDVANRLLRSQLSETTLSFRNALETTQQFLLEGDPPLATSRRHEHLGLSMCMHVSACGSPWCREALREPLVLTHAAAITHFLF